MIDDGVLPWSLVLVVLWVLLLVPWMLLVPWLPLWDSSRRCRRWLGEEVRVLRVGDEEGDEEGEFIDGSPSPPSLLPSLAFPLLVAAPTLVPVAIPPLLLLAAAVLLLPPKGEEKKPPLLFDCENGEDSCLRLNIDIEDALLGAGWGEGGASLSL